MDKTGSGYITLDEFAEAMKLYQIHLNKIGLMKLFLRGDEEAEGLITPETFSEIISSLEEKTAVAIIDSLGKECRIVQCCFGCNWFLALLFGFLFLGLSTFSKPGAFNAATSSTLFLGIGNSMGEDDDDEEDDEGDDDDGASDEIVEALTENMEVLEA